MRHCWRPHIAVTTPPSVAVTIATAAATTISSTAAFSWLLPVPPTIAVAAVIFVAFAMATATPAATVFVVNIATAAVTIAVVECWMLLNKLLGIYDYGKTIICLSFPSINRATAPGQYKQLYLNMEALTKHVPYPAK
jgi:hypothetical protein